MPYTNSININIGSSKAGLTLYATLFDTNGDPISGQDYLTSGFVEFEKGNYLWTYASFPTDFRGAVAFYNDANDDFLAMTSINPEEIEKVKYIADVIDELTNPPKEITVEVPHILTQGSTVEVIAGSETPNKPIQIITGTGS